MRVSFYTPYPLDKEFSWRHSFEWVEDFASGSISFKSTSNSVKFLSVQPLVIFKFISLKTVDNHMNLVESTYNGVSTSAGIANIPYHVPHIVFFYSLFTSLFSSLFHGGIDNMFSLRNSWKVY